MRKKALAAAFMSVMMAAGVLSGCGDSSTQSTQNNASGDEAQKEDTGNEDGQDEGGESSGPVDITIMALRDDSYTPWSETTMIKEIEEECKDLVNITWIDLPGSMKAEKLNLAFSGGDYPDLVMGSWAIEGTNVVDYANQGILLPMDEYITPEIMPNLSAKLEARPEWKEGITLDDGHIYELVSRAEMGAAYDRTFNDEILINTEWLEAVGKEMPTTTDELYDVLKAFKEAGDLNGNGEADEIPMSACYGTTGWGHHINGMYSMFGWFGIAQNQKGMQEKDGKIIFNAMQPEWKDAVSFFHKLYSEGLLDMETFTHDGSTYNAKTINSETPMVGVYATWNNISVNKLLGSDVYQVMPVLKSSNGEEPQWARRYTPITFTGTVWMTDKAEGKQEQIMKFLDTFFSTERSIESNNGKLGKYVTHVEGNTYHVEKDEQGNTFADDVKSAESTIKYGPYMLLADEVVFDEVSESDMNNAEVIEVYKDYVQPEPTFVNNWMSAEDSAEATLLEPDLQDYVRSTIAKWITEGGVEEEWDSYVSTLKDNLQLEKWMKMKVNDSMEDKISIE